MPDENKIEWWLGKIGLGQYAAKFVEQNIDFAELFDLTDQDLAELGVSIGHRKRLNRAIDLLRAKPQTGQQPGEILPTSLHEAERRQVTVLFADLADSTALSTRLDPEDMRDIIRAYRSYCEQEIRRFGGYSARYIGDGILVYFGYPSSHENDPERGVRAGLAIIGIMRELNDKVASKYGVRLKVRIGIATGIVVVGDIISDSAVEQSSAVGETPNLAARLQAVANPNTVVVPPSTRSLLGDLFEFQSLGKHELKGIDGSIEVSRVVGAKAIESRFVATHATQLTELVGRHEELRVLTSRWEEVTKGNHAVVLIASEPGVGKSRLVQEFRQQIEPESHLRLTAQCWSHTENSALYPIIETVQRTLRIDRDDSTDARLDKLESALRDIDLSISKLAPLIAALLNLDASDRYPPLRLSPDAQKRETFAALIEILATLAGQQPLLVVMEDIHWIDPSSREFISFLLPRIERLRLMFLATIRTGYQDRWPSYAETQQLELHPISATDTRTMIIRIAGRSTLSRSLVERIVHRADGIPLYIEELTRLVISDPTKRDAMAPEAIPSSLQDLLLARLNSLTWEREVARLGAVLGRRFDHSLIGAVWQGELSSLTQGLDRLVDEGILSHRRSGAENTYTFRHMLIQEAAYASLLRSDRRSMHKLIADVLEQRYVEGAVGQPELLADHFENADEIDKAVEYLLKAGQQCSDRSANHEAIIHLNRGLELLTRLPAGADRLQKELSLLVAISRPLVRTRGYASPEAERILVRARELCAKLGDSPQLIAVLCGLSIFSQARGDLSQARELGEQSLRMAEPTNDKTLRLLAYRSLGGAAFWQGDLQVSRDYLQQGVEIYDPKVHSGLAYVYFVDPGVVCLSTLGLALWTLGFPDEAVARARESVSVAEGTYHPYSVGYAKLYLATLNQIRLEPEPVRDTARDVITLSEAQEYPQGVSWGRALLGWALCRLGDSKQGTELIVQGINQWRATGTKLILPYFLSLLGDVHLKAGKTEEGLRVVEEALALAKETGECCWQAELYRLRGELKQRGLQAEDELDSAVLTQAESDFRLALSDARGKCARALELRAAYSLVRCLLRQGQQQEAQALLHEQCTGWDESLQLPDVRAAHELLSNMT